MKPRTLNEEEENGWEGTVLTIKKTIASNMKDQKVAFESKIHSVEA